MNCSRMPWVLSQRASTLSSYGLIFLRQRLRLARSCFSIPLQTDMIEDTAVTKRSSRRKYYRAKPMLPFFQDPHVTLLAQHKFLCCNAPLLHFFVVYLRNFLCRTQMVFPVPPTPTFHDKRDSSQSKLYAHGASFQRPPTTLLPYMNSTIYDYQCMQHKMG